MAARVNPVEAARVAAILEDALEKLSFLSAITPDVLMHRDEVAELTSGEIARLISEQRSLEAKYEDLVAQRAQLKGAGNKSRFKDLQSEIQSVSYQIRESMKNLCRSLKENPDVSESLARITEEREALALLLEKTLTDLRDGHYSSLVTFVEKEHDTREKMRAVAYQEEEVMKEVEQLTVKLREEDEKHAAEMETKKLELSDIKDKLRKLKIDTTLTLRYARKEAAAKTESTARACTAEEADILTKINEVRKNIELETEVHDKEMEVLKLEHDELAKMANEWGQKFVEDVKVAETELAKLNSIREQQRTALIKHQERYDKELADLAEKEAEDERARDTADVARVEEERRQAAATQIQRVLGEMFTVVSAAASIAKDAKKGAKAGAGKKKKK